MRLYTLPAINDDILQLPLGIDPPPVDNSVPVASLEHGGMVLIRDIFDFGRGDVETCDHEDRCFEYGNVGDGVDSEAEAEAEAVERVDGGSIWKLRTNSAPVLGGPERMTSIPGEARKSGWEVEGQGERM